ncbi:MAG: MBL fold metallo-hydrolase [Bacteroidales bacterium]|nr:MBL fold metallo-hydrolase [Bacteroidales bacterium]
MKVARFGLTLFGVNCYVVWDPSTKECAVIDPGIIEEKERSALKNFIAKNDLKVTNVINTHLHIDHCIGNDFVTKEFGVPSMAHKADAPLGKQIRQQAQMFGIPGEVNDVEVTTYLEEGDVIKIGNGALEVIHVPGHSPGGIVLYDRKDGFLISGDVLFQGSVGRSDLPGGNHQQLIEGIRNKLLTLPDNTDVFSGHGPATTIGEERLHNPFLQD